MSLLPYISLHPKEARKLPQVIFATWVAKEEMQGWQKAFLPFMKSFEQIYFAPHPMEFPSS